MNRRDRRRAAAMGRRATATGYEHRLAAAATGLHMTPGVHHVTVEHDAWCAIYRGGQCNCVPNITISGPDGITVVDEAGVPVKRAKS
jgi:hypothetical protein